MTVPVPHVGRSPPVQARPILFRPVSRRGQ